MYSFWELVEREAMDVSYIAKECKLEEEGLANRIYNGELTTNEFIKIHEFFKHELDYYDTAFIYEIAKNKHNGDSFTIHQHIRQRKKSH